MAPKQWDTGCFTHFGRLLPEFGRVYNSITPSNTFLAGPLR
jgi:hypothetical protein